MKLIVTGYGEHGKDSVCKLLEQMFGMSWTGSSAMACRLFIFLALCKKHGYKNYEECYNDRMNHRKEWYEMIREYNTPDKARLGKQIFGIADVYCGIRDAEEMQALKDGGYYDYAIWVDSSSRLPPESGDSMDVTKDHCDIILYNNDVEEMLPLEISRVIGDLEVRMKS